MRAGAALGRAWSRPVPLVERASTRGIVVLLLCVIPLSQFPIDVYTPAIPVMSTDLGTSVDVVQASVSAYVLGLAVAQLPVGVLADRYGRRRVLLACLGLLAVASLGTAASTGIGMLLVMRFLEGIGGAACMVLAYAIAGDIARGDRLASLSGWLGASWGLAPVIAPAIGGALVQFLSWRGIFLLVAAMAAAALVGVVFGLPETLDASRRIRVSPGDVWSTARRALRNHVYLATVLAFAVFGAAQLMFGIIAPLLYQTRLDFPPAAYGLFALLIGAANLVGELTTGALATRVPHRVIAGIALASFILGMALLLFGGLVMGADVWTLTLGGMLALFGCGTLCPLMFGRAVDLFTTNLGLISGLASAITYLVIALAMTAAAALPDVSSAPLGSVYLGVAIVGSLLLRYSLSANRKAGPASVS